MKSGLLCRDFRLKSDTGFRVCPALRNLYQPHPQPIAAVLNPIPAESKILFPSPHHPRRSRFHPRFIPHIATTLVVLQHFSRISEL